MKKKTVDKRVVDLAEKKSRDAMFQAFSAYTKAIRFTDTSCRVDGYLTGNTGTRVVFETKLRDIPLKTYKKDGFLIEKIKWDALKHYKELTNEDKALFINILRDMDLVWDISKLPEPKWEIRNCTLTTAEDYGKKRVPKVVGFLKLDDAIWKRKKS